MYTGVGGPLHTQCLPTDGAVAGAEEALLRLLPATQPLLQPQDIPGIPKRSCRVRLPSASGLQARPGTPLAQHVLPPHWLQPQGPRTERRGVYSAVATRSCITWEKGWGKGFTQWGLEPHQRAWCSVSSDILRCSTENPVQTGRPLLRPGMLSLCTEQAFVDELCL